MIENTIVIDLQINELEIATEAGYHVVESKMYLDVEDFIINCNRIEHS
jgi:two-component SAPR family response regulator